MIFAIVAGAGVLLLALVGRAKTNAVSSASGSKDDNGATGTGGQPAGVLDTNGDGSIDGSELKNRIGFGGQPAAENKQPVSAPISRGKPPSTPVNRPVSAAPSTIAKPASPLPPVATSAVPLVRKTFVMR